MSLFTVFSWWPMIDTFLSFFLPFQYFKWTKPFCSLCLTFIIDFVLILQVEENICKFAKKGMTPSQIGVILRDSHGIAQVKSVTGSKILRILKAHGLFPLAFYWCRLLFSILNSRGMFIWFVVLKLVRACSWNSRGSLSPH